MSKKLSSFAILLAVLILGMRSAFAITWFSEETGLNELYNDIRSSAPDLGTQTEFGYMGSTMGSDDDDWICFTAGKSGTLTISQYSSSNTEVYHDVTYFTDPIATPYVSGKMSVSKGVKYYFCINNYKLWQTSEFYYWVFSIGGVTPTPSVTISPTSASKGSSSGTGSISVSANTSWSASTSASWITISSGKSGSGSGTINYSYSANSSSSSRTGYIYVSYSSGEASFELTQSGSTPPSKPDLVPQTPSGWSAPLVTSTSSTSKTGSSTFKDTDVIYVSWSVNCNNASISSPFKSTLYVDGSAKCDFNFKSASAGGRVYYEGYSIGKLSAGSHTIKIVADSGSAISESNESNNTYSKTITVTATQKYYTVKFHKNDGSGETKTLTYVAGASLTLPWINSGLDWATPSGWSIVGWARSVSATSAEYANGATVPALGTAEQTVDLWVVWKKSVPQPKTYTVRFHKNEPDKGNIDPTRHVEATYDQSFTLGKSQSLAWKDSKIGWVNPKYYRFLGWARSSSATVAQYSNGQSVLNLGTANERVDLYAVWALMPSTYLVRFYRNNLQISLKVGGVEDVHEQSFKCGATQGLAWKDSQMKWGNPSGKMFLGWAKSRTATVAAYKNGESVRNIGADGEVVCLYAVWGDQAQTYTVRFDKNDGNGATETRTYSAGASLTLPWINSGLGWTTPSGWSIVGWARSASATTAAYANGATVPALGTSGQTVDLYVVWKKPATGKYTVVLHRNFNSADTPRRELLFACGVEQQLPWMDSQIAWTPRSGYIFLGWSKSATATGATYSNGQKVKDLGAANSTVHLYAIWRANPLKSAAMAQQTSGAAESYASTDGGEAAFTPGPCRGEFAGGSGTFDLLLDEDGAAFFRAETEDGAWSAECEAEVVGETLLLMFETDEPIVIRMENGQMIAERRE